MSKYPSAFSLSFCLCLCFLWAGYPNKEYIYGLFVMVLSNFEYPDLVDLIKFLTNFQPEPWKKSSFKSNCSTRWAPCSFGLGWTFISQLLSLPNAWHAMLEKPANNCFWQLFFWQMTIRQYVWTKQTFSGLALIHLGSLVCFLSTYF